MFMKNWEEKDNLGEPVLGLQFEQVEQLLFFENCVTNNIDMDDLGGITFINVDIERNAIALLLIDFKLNTGTVHALPHILLFQRQLHAFQRGRFEHLTNREIGFGHVLPERFGGNQFIAFDVDLGDGWALRHAYDQHVVFCEHLDVIKKI